MHFQHLLISILIIGTLIPVGLIIFFNGFNQDIITENIFYEVDNPPTEPPSNPVNLAIEEQVISGTIVNNTSSILFNKKINKMTVILTRVGNPVDNAIIGIFDIDGNLVKQFGTIQANTVTVSPIKTLYSFSSSSYTIQNQDVIGIKYINGTTAGGDYLITYINLDEDIDGINTSWFVRSIGGVTFILSQYSMVGELSFFEQESITVNGLVFVIPVISLVVIIIILISKVKER